MILQIPSVLDAVEGWGPGMGVRISILLSRTTQPVWSQRPLQQAGWLDAEWLVRPEAGFCPMPGCSVGVSHSHPSPCSLLPSPHWKPFCPWCDITGRDPQAGVSNLPPPKSRAAHTVGLIDAAGGDDSLLTMKSCFPQPWLLSLRNCRTPCLADTLSLQS